MDNPLGFEAGAYYRSRNGSIVRIESLNPDGQGDIPGTVIAGGHGDPVWWGEKPGEKSYINIKTGRYGLDIPELSQMDLIYDGEGLHKVAKEDVLRETSEEKAQK